MSKTFAENEIGLVRDYMGAAGADPAAMTGAMIAGLQAGLPSGLLQERNPFHQQILINKPAVRRRNARLLVVGFLTDLTTVLAALDAVCRNLAKQEYGLAATGIATAPQLGPTVSAADFAEAFVTTDLGYIEVTGTSAEPDQVDHTLLGYAGPAPDIGSLLAAVELVTGGTERAAQLGLLQAELDTARGDLGGLVHAVGEYRALLPASTTAPWDRFGLHLDLFAGFGSADTVAAAGPRGKFVALRAAYAHLALGDCLLRSRRSFDDADRAAIGQVYDAGVSLVHQIGVAADNPQRQETEARALQQQSKLQSRSNVLGLWDGFVPVQRYSQLELDATAQIDAAIASAAAFQSFLAQAEQETEQQMDLQLQQQLEQTNLQILDLQQQNATLGVDKIDEQIQAIEDQRVSLDDDIGLTPIKSIVDGLSALMNSKDPTTSVLGAGMGLVTTLMHAAAQREELDHQERMAQIEREIGRNQEVIVGLEHDMSRQRLAYYAEKLAFLTGKGLNADLLYLLADINERRAERQLEAAIFLAYLYERSLAFFLGEPNIRFIAFDYRDRPGDILDAAKALREDFQRVLQQRDQADEAKFDAFEQAVSLRESLPARVRPVLADRPPDLRVLTLRAQQAPPRDAPVSAPRGGGGGQGAGAGDRFSGTLTHRGRFLVRDRTATLTDPAATRLVPTAAQLAAALDEQRRQGLPVAAVGGVLVYDLDPDTKELSQDTQFVSHTPPDQTTLHVFEGTARTGSGSWRSGTSTTSASRTWCCT